MPIDFKILKNAVAAKFQVLQAQALYQTDVKGEALWEAYLSAFPEGTDPIYRQRTEHNCSACRSFIKNVGNCVAIVDGKLVSIWDVQVSEPIYQAVADSMAQLVKSQVIENVFLTVEPKAGVDKNFEEILGSVVTWQHFFVNIPAKFMATKADIGALLGNSKTTYEVMLRGLTETSSDAISTVLDLISQNSIYRGEEHKSAVQAFEALKSDFDKLSAEEKSFFVWSKVITTPLAVSRIRNTSIGTLLTDISEGKDLEDSVKSFESKVAPQNYKRPTALVTKAMIGKAQEKIEELGLMSALSRRHAMLSDVTINNILHVHSSVRAKLTSNVFEDIAASLPEKAKSYDKVEEVSIDKFVADIVPRIESMEVLFENRHGSNLVSLIAPEDPTAGSLFKWGNNFSWDYAGGLADSAIRKTVQERGGRVDGVFRFSHSWNHHEGKRNTSLMDLHVFMPGNGITDGNPVNDVYGNNQRVGWNQRDHIKSGGTQDVDYTGAAQPGYIPVENITFPSLQKMPEGRYVCKVHNWSYRDPTTSGFSAEVEFGGEVFQYDHPAPLGSKKWVTVAEVTLKDGQFTIEHKLPTATSSRTKWGMPTESFRKVSMLMHSPNHWDGEGVGNLHYFFMLEGAVREDAVRGFYNEFLKNDLTLHRKAFEMVGSRMKSEGTSEQLSGLGFSSTQKNSVVVRVKGAVSRIVKVTF